GGIGHHPARRRRLHAHGSRLALDFSTLGADSPSIRFEHLLNPNAQNGDEAEVAEMPYPTYTTNPYAAAATDTAAAHHYLVVVYTVHAARASALPVWLAHMLYSNGAVFLEGVFDKTEVAVAVNRLLVTGFFMINLGYAMFLLKSNVAADATSAI